MKDWIQILVITTILLGIITTLNLGPAEKHIWIDNQIKDDASYVGLAHTLQGYKGKITVHLVGPGGDYTGVQYLANLFQSLPDVIMEVDGTVQSGHAMLALMGGKHILILNKGFFMLHLVSGTGMEQDECMRFKGELDRGLDAEQKCEQDEKTTRNIMNQEIIDSSAPYLTSEEMNRLKSGQEVYIPNAEMNRRIKHG